MNLADFFTDTVGCIPDHPAIRYVGQTVTFAEMNRKVDALAYGFNKVCTIASSLYM